MEIADTWPKDQTKTQSAVEKISVVLRPEKNVALKRKEKMFEICSSVSVLLYCNYKRQQE